ncbi:MAG TPA: RnfABCDGE type electron transport complex subunit D [bacterium]|nr:RnfABCDGE type electron transport complex subunit D [bacterium]
MRTTPPPATGSRLDPRLYQIAILTGLLIYGIGWLEFDLTVPRVALYVGVALATQFVCTKLWKLDRFDPKSALISSLSLSLLLRTDSIAYAVLGAVITIAAKFVIRVPGVWGRRGAPKGMAAGSPKGDQGRTTYKHIFNPTNGAIVAMLLLGKGWVSPGQWGNVAFFAFLMACLGGLVVNRAARADVTYAFIASYLALVFWRSWHLGEPMTIPVHRLENGGLLLFTFFMISDPKTTPNSRMGRVIFAELVAAGAYFIQFKLFRTNGLMWSLAIFALVVPIIDRLLPGELYQWVRPPATPARDPVPEAAPAVSAPILLTRSAS